MPRRTRFALLFVPVPVMLLVYLLEAVGATIRVGDRIYDLSLRLEQPPPVARELLLLDIDDRAIAAAGAWPWSRDVLADGLLLLKEFDARCAVFDTPFAGRAPLGVDRHVLREELPEELEGELSGIEANVRSLFDAIRRGSVKPADSPRYVAELTGLISAAKVRLLDAVARVERDSDLYLGQALRLFERSFVAVELDSSRSASPPSPEDLVPLEHFALEHVSGVGASPLEARGLYLPAPAIAQGARGGGYREIPADPDGVVRRARLLAQLRGRHVGQAAFAALLDRLGRPAVLISPELITLQGGLAIPLTPEGELLIDWPRAGSGQALRRLSWTELFQHGQLEANLLSALREMDRAGALAYYPASPSVLELYAAAASIRDGVLAGGETARLDEWRNARSRFFALAEAFLSEDVDKRIISDAERSLASEGPTAEEKLAISRTLDRVPELFREARRALAGLLRSRTALRESLPGSFCVVSVTGAAATLLGSTPLGRPATPGECSAALVNTILSARFIRALPRWYGLAAAAFLGLCCSIALIRARPLVCLVAGGVLGVLAAVTAALLLVFERIYVDPTAAALCALMVSTAVAAIKAAQARADRPAEW